MDILGMVGDFISNPLGMTISIVGAGAIGVLSYQLFKIANSIIRPMQALKWMLSQEIILLDRLDDEALDKIKNDKIKRDLQTERNNIIREHINILNKHLDFWAD